MCSFKETLGSNPILHSIINKQANICLLFYHSKPRFQNKWCTCIPSAQAWFAHTSLGHSVTQTCTHKSSWMPLYLSHSGHLSRQSYNVSSHSMSFTNFIFVIWLVKAYKKNFFFYKKGNLVFIEGLIKFYKELDPQQCCLKVILGRQAITDEDREEKTGKNSY